MAEKEAPAKGRPPDYTLNCIHRLTDAKGKVGVAWKNSDGRISIVIDPFVTLPPGREIVLSLFPAGSYEEKAKGPRTAADAVDELNKGKGRREPGEEVPF